MEQTSEARITYSPRPDVTPESEVGAVSCVLRFILFESKASKKAAEAGGPDDAKESQSDCTATNKYT
jgi:hypothetical protein